MICPKCKKDSVIRSTTYPENLVCKNKLCPWYMKDDIRKLQGVNSEGFKFSNNNFERHYENLMNNYEAKFYNKEQRYDFLKDFLRKHHNEVFYIVTKDMESKKDLREKISRDKFISQNIMEVTAYNEFTRHQKKESHILFYEIFDPHHITNLKSLVRYCETYYFIC